MERRFLTKALWAAAVVMLAVGALGQGVLAERSPDSCSVTLVCTENGVVSTNVVMSHRDGVMDVRQDSLVGRLCYPLLTLAASPVGDPPNKIQASTVQVKDALFDILVYDVATTAACP